MYLLQTNCRRGSALEGCALGREGVGLGDVREHVYLLDFIRKTPWRLLLRSETWGFTGGNKINERGMKRKNEGERERGRDTSALMPTPQ